MLEDVIFGQMSMPGEIIRLLLAFLGVGVVSYYDLFNNKNIPDKVLYAFLGIAFIVNLVFFQEDLFWFSIAMALFFSLVGYVFYRVGQLGGADVYVLASVILLLPVHPSFVGLSFNMPYILSVIIFSGVLFALYVLGFFGFRLSQVDAKPKLLYGLMFIPYLLFAYVYINSFLFSPLYFAFVSILLFATIFFMMYRESLIRLLSETLPVAQLEAEDVLALELMNKDMIERYKLPRVIKENDLERLKKSKIGEVTVYTKLPPFVPFILVGMLLALFFAKDLLLL